MVLTDNHPPGVATSGLAWREKVSYGVADMGFNFFTMVCYTGINIPYNGLSGVMSSDPQERTTINGLCFIFAFGGSTLVTAATPFLVKWLGHGHERWAGS